MLCCAVLVAAGCKLQATYPPPARGTRTESEAHNSTNRGQCWPEHKTAVLFRAGRYLRGTHALQQARMMVV